MVFHAYAIVKIETDQENFEEITKVIQNSENEVSGNHTLIDVISVTEVRPQDRDETPILYWP